MANRHSRDISTSIVLATYDCALLQLVSVLLYRFTIVHTLVENANFCIVVLLNTIQDQSPAMSV